MRILAAGVLGLALSLPATALADHRLSERALLGGAIGGAVGAYLGAELGGRDGALLGGALGSLTGVAVATDGYSRRYHTTRHLHTPTPHRHHHSHYHHLRHSKYYRVPRHDHRPHHDHRHRGGRHAVPRAWAPAQRHYHYHYGAPGRSGSCPPGLVHQGRC